MTTTQIIENFAQSAYLKMTGQFFDDITGSDGQVYISQIIDWSNQLAQELQEEADWNYMRTNNHSLGSVSTKDQTFLIDTTEIKNVCKELHRPLRLINSDGKVMSSWVFVRPDQFNISSDGNYPDRVSIIGNEIMFNRDLTTDELNCTARCDIINVFPELTTSDASLISLVQPRQLLLAGVCSKALLADIVSSNLYPQATADYTNLLTLAKKRNSDTTRPDYIDRQDFSDIRGVY